MDKKILIYGNFDMYNNRHRKIIVDWKSKGYKIYVGLETDEYMQYKDKDPMLNYDMRMILLEYDPLVDFVFSRNSETQIMDDFNKYKPEFIIIDNNFRNKELCSDYKDISFKFEKIDFTDEIKGELINSNVVITYGTYDLLHYGHLNIFENAKSEGDILIVAVSSDEFNSRKNKKAYDSFASRIRNVSENKFVNYVIPELNWSQKKRDFKNLFIDTLVMGGDWKGKFDNLDSNIRVKIFDRTEGVSSTMLRKKQ